MTSLLAPISVGELLDKLSILELKAAAIADPVGAANVRREREALDTLRRRAVPPLPELEPLYRDLSEVNRRLWEIEDALRAHEQAGRFDEAFIALARRVYRENDRRAALKRRINELTGSAIVEEKLYPEYDRPGG
jgi:hypothetical protein